jgi:outer membrane protein OmpA-like peptidoglycan-associated protein/tetratricopeptide (TPR) repeat protein
MKKTLTILLLLFSIVLMAQNRKIKSANNEYDKLAFMDVVSIYEKVADKGYGTSEIYQKIGNAYYFNGDYINASKWYDKLFQESNSQIDSEYYYRYSQVLKSIGEKEKAEKFIKNFSNLQPKDSRSLFYKENNNYLKEIEKVSNRYKIEDSKVNSKFSDYGTAFYKEGVVFTTSRGGGKIHTWTNQPYTDLYEATIDSKGFLNSPNKFDKKINSKLNESTAVFTKDGKTIYFTRNNFIKNKEGKNIAGTILLKIYTATLNSKGNWDNIIALPFNSDEYNCAHPALSPDGKTLYFASDMPGTIGQSDLFKVYILGENKFSEPINLGEKINTHGRETFPFVSDENEIYFASDGHLGLGGLDIFGAKIKSKISFSKIYNIGKPVNTEFDDFCYIINSNTGIGYFSSNKMGGKGFDDIYKFKEEKKLLFNCIQEIEGLLIDSKTSEIISNGNIILFDEKMIEIAKTTSNADGYFSFQSIDCSSKYFVRAECKEYESNEVTVGTRDVSGKTNTDVSLTKRFNEISENLDLAKVYGIENIYFDIDKWNITKRAEDKLVIILTVLEQHPNIKIDVRSHTDSRSSYAYNMRLSDRRVKSTIAWLVKKGINRSRLTGNGYGESQLVNKCKNGVTCSEAEHQVNRRSEFIIVN